MLHATLTDKIIGCAFRVYNTIGSGFLESVYHNCMLIELKKTGLSYESQKDITIQYEGEIVGDFIADIIVEDKVIVELKSIRQLAEAHEVQLVNYLTATGKQVGLLINFGEERVEIRRKLKDLVFDTEISGTS